MKRCTFPAGCTDTATGVDAYGHPVCDRHAPIDFEIVVMPEKWVDSDESARIEYRPANPGDLAVTAIDRENGVVTLGQMGMSEQTIERERRFRNALAEAEKNLMSPDAAREALMRLPPWLTS